MPEPKAIIERKPRGKHPAIVVQEASNPFTPGERLLTLPQAASVTYSSEQTIRRRAKQVPGLAVHNEKGHIVGIREEVLETIKVVQRPPAAEAQKNHYLIAIARVFKREEGSDGLSVPDPLEVAIEVGCPVKIVHDFMLMTMNARALATELRKKRWNEQSAEQEHELRFIQLQAETDKREHDRRMARIEMEKDEEAYKKLSSANTTKSNADDAAE